MNIDRRTILTATAGAAALAATPGSVRAAGLRTFPKDFRWGVATAAHQTEGNNTASDLWLAEQVKPSLFREPSADANNAFELWESDLDLVKSLGLNTYRFSIEWARIEPEPGQFSAAMLNHYARVIEGCRARGLAPMVTFNHFTVPRWFAARGGWTVSDSADLFARFCAKAAARLAGGMAYAITLNEPNMVRVIGQALPPEFAGAVTAMNAAAGKACNAPGFKNAMMPETADIPVIEANLLAAHKAARAAIKAARADLPVGVSLAVSDDQAAGKNSLRDKMRALFYGPWLELAKQDDFVGVQNYARAVWTSTGQLPPPKGSVLNAMGTDVYAPSLAGAVRYVHGVTGKPIMITEHGIGTDDDTIRTRFIPEALAGLHEVIGQGVPVLGYVHWTLADNFEWIFGYAHKFGLCSVDRATFARAPKPSAAVLRDIASSNAVRVSLR